MSELLKSDLLLLLLFSKGYSGKNNEPVRGITRLMKLVFLLDREGKINNLYSFEPYKMGPFSNEVYPEVEFLTNYPPSKPLVKTNSSNQTELEDPDESRVIEDASSLNGIPLTSQEVNVEYELSDSGKKIAEELWKGLSDDQRRVIEDIKSKYGSLTLRDLLKYVYRNYPEMTTRSEIKDQL